MVSSGSTGWMAAALGLALAGPALIPPAWAQTPALAQATEALRASLEEWRREDTAYRSARGAARISARESEEYAGYVAGLRLRVLEQCEVVRGIGGEEAIKDLDCVRGSNETRRAGSVVAPEAVLTDDEKRAQMQARLDALEGDIDDSLQKRQQEIRQTATGSGRGTGAGGGSAGSGSGSGSGSASAREGGREGGQGTWSNPDAVKPSDEKFSEEGRATAATPGGTPSASTSGSTSGNRQGNQGRQASRDGASDDDVVARQLREAAEKETDPVLKEKLWAEYRKYKEGKK